MRVELMKALLGPTEALQQHSRSDGPNWTTYWLNEQTEPAGRKAIIIFIHYWQRRVYHSTESNVLPQRSHDTLALIATLFLIITTAELAIKFRFLATI